MQPNQQQPDTKNFIFAMVLSLAMLFAYQYFWLEPQAKLKKAEAVKVETIQKEAAKGSIPAAAMLASMPRDEALKMSPRIEVENDFLKGSVSVFGGRLDDLNLQKYKDTIEKTSNNVTLLSPQGTKQGYYTFFGWTGANIPNLPGPNTVWKQVAGTKLTPSTPITLEYDNGAGLKFTRKIEIDKEYLFTYTDSVTNSGTTPISIQSYGAIRRFAKPLTPPDGVNHEGTVSVLEGKLNRIKYKDLEKGKGEAVTSNGGWLGFADKYWLVALIPDQNDTISTNFKADKTDTGYVYETSFLGKTANLGAGQTISHTERVYAGAKVSEDLDKYGAALKLPNFENAIDWGKLWFISRPFHEMLMFFYKHIGNIGLAMLAITVVIKIITFPLVYQSYKSFAKMRDLGPKMKEIQDKFADDKQKQQQEILKFYQTEKINPVAGCIPMILTMPIFLALFKVLSISLELRHAPFYGWIPDLSAKDPTSFLNLFGLIPFDPMAIPVIGGFFAIGAWPLLYGVSMWLLQKMQPTATDAMQAKIFALMPWLFAILFASFSSGLVIYYTWSNLLTIVQQYIIAKRSGSSNPIDEFFAKLGKKA